jgi:hypothetical protein
MMGRFPLRPLQFALLFALTAGTSSPQAQNLPHYAFPGLRGTVVAHETGQRLSGAFVIALWVSPAPPPYQFKTARAVETETGANGSFTLPPWEGTFSNPLTSLTPGLLFFSPGRVAESSGRPLPRSDKDSEYRLPLFEDPPDRRASQLRKFASALGLHWITLYGQPSPGVLAALDADWHKLSPEEQGNGSPSQMFEGTVQSMRYIYEQQLLKQR